MDRNKFIDDLIDLGATDEEIAESIQVAEQRGIISKKPTQPAQPAQPASEPSIATALLPRVTRAAEEEAGIGRKALSAGLDISSLPLRAGAAGLGELSALLGAATSGATKQPIGKIQPGEKLTPYSEGFLQSLARTGGKEGAGILENLAEEIVRDPANIPAFMASGGLAALPKIVQGGKWAVRAAKAAPIIGETAASVGAHQAEHLAAGEKMRPGEAAIETGLSFGIPGLTKGLGKMSREGGKRAMQGIIKPIKKLQKQGAQDLIGKAMESGVTGSLDDMSNIISTRFDDLGKAMSDVMQQADQTGQVIDLTDIFANVEKRLAQNKNLAPIRDQVANNFDRAFNNLSGEFGAGTGQMLPSEALKLKRVSGKMGAWTKAVDDVGNLRTITDPESSAREIVYNELYKEINSRLKKVVDPYFQEINRQFSELIPVEKAITDAQLRIGKRDIISLGEIISFLPGGMAGAMIHPAGIGGGLATYGLYKASRSPVAMSGLFQTGKGLEKTAEQLAREGVPAAILRQLMRQPAREEIYNPGGN